MNGLWIFITNLLFRRKLVYQSTFFHKTKEIREALFQNSIQSYYITIPKSAKGNTRYFVYVNAADESCAKKLINELKETG